MFTYKHLVELFQWMFCLIVVLFMSENLII